MLDTSGILLDANVWIQTTCTATWPLPTPSHSLPEPSQLTRTAYLMTPLNPPAQPILPLFIGAWVSWVRLVRVVF